MKSDVSTAKSDISTLKSDVSTAKSDITTLKSDVATDKSDISTLKSDVSTAKSDISTLKSDVSTAKSDISTLKSDVSTAKTDISNLKSDVLVAESSIVNLQSDVNTLNSDMLSAQSDISTLKSDVSTAKSDIVTLKSDVSTAKSDIVTLKSDVSTAKSNISQLQTDVAAKISSSQKGSANGVAELDSNGKVPTAQLPASIVGALKYKGTLDASLGVYPSNPAQGDYYVISVAGSISGHAYHVGDWAVYDGVAWDDIDNSQTVTSVNSKVGAVVLKSDDIAEGTVNKYFTDVRASAAAPVQSVAGKSGVVVLAKADVGLGNVDNTSDASKPISTAVQTALDLKQNSLGTGTNSQFLRGDLSWATISASKGTRIFTVGIDANTIAGCIALCTSPSATNNYIIEIPPGSYTEDLTIPGNVHLKGMASPGDTLSVKIIGQHTVTGTSNNALNNRVVIANILFTSSHATTPILTVSGTLATTQVQISGSFFTQTATQSTSKTISIGAFGSVYLNATLIRNAGAGAGGTAIVMSAAGAQLYSQFGLDIDGGSCALDMQAAGYAQIIGGIIGTQGSQVIKIAASGSVGIASTSITNNATVGHGVNMVGAGASFLAAHSTFNVLNDASTYAVTGVAGTYYAFFSINYGNLAALGVVRNTKIGASVTQTRYSGSLASADLSDFSSAAQSAVVVNAINSGVTATAPSQAAVYTALGNKLATAGGTMSGAIAMGSNKITGLAAGSANGDAVRYEQVLLLAGGTMSGAIAMGSNKITGLSDPSAASQDAASAAYVDAAGGLSAGLAASGTNISMSATARKISVSSGSTATKVILPSLSTLVVGEQCNIINSSSATLTIRNPGDTADVATLPPGHMAFITVANLTLPGAFGSAIIQLRQNGYNAASSKITNLAAGTANGDAVRYEQVLLLAGGTMSGAIAMGSNKITGLANPTAGSQEAATAKYVDDAIAAASGGNFDKEKFTLSSADIANGYITLARLAKSKSIKASVGRLCIHEGSGDDYTVSTVGGVSRITFLNSLIYPGVEALVAGDVVFVEYSY